jgi:GNAT superfamily N-acetyltransferase
MGYSSVPPGKLATVVTCLAMEERPQPKESRVPAGYTLERLERPDLDRYRGLYRLIGEDWLWISRLVMSDEELSGNIHHPQVEIFVLRCEGRDVGMLELDFREDKAGEIVFLGLTKDAIGTGAGRYLMDRALSIAWSHPIERLWLHTCTLDSPSALPFYLRSGFKPYAFLVEVIDDPRLDGTFPRTAAPHIPLLTSATAARDD